MTKAQREAIAMIVEGFRVTVETSDHLDQWLAGYYYGTDVADADVVAQARRVALEAVGFAKAAMYPRLARTGGL